MRNVLLKAITFLLTGLILTGCSSQNDNSPRNPVAAASSDAITNQVASTTTTEKQTEQQEAATDPQTTVQAKKGSQPKSKYICRTERSTGSHMSRRICRTRAQVEEERKNAEQLMDDMRSMGSQVTGGESN